MPSADSVRDRTAQYVEKIAPLAASARETAAVRAEEAREWAAPRVTQAVGQAREWAAPRVEQARTVMAPRVEQARTVVTPRVEQARTAVAPRVEHAVEVLSPRIEHAVDAVTPRVEHAVDVLAPRVEQTVDRVRDAAEEVGPKLVAGLAAAAAATEPARTEARRRGLAAVSALKGELELPDPPKKRRRGRKVLFLLAIGGAGVAAWRSLTRSDEDLWTTPTAPSTPQPAGVGTGTFDSPGTRTGDSGTAAGDPISGVAAPAGTASKAAGLTDEDTAQAEVTLSPAGGETPSAEDLDATSEESTTSGDAAGADPTEVAADTAALSGEDVAEEQQGLREQAQQAVESVKNKAAETAESLRRDED